MEARADRGSGETQRVHIPAINTHIWLWTGTGTPKAPEIPVTVTHHRGGYNVITVRDIQPSFPLTFLLAPSSPKHTSDWVTGLGDNLGGASRAADRRCRGPLAPLCQSTEAPTAHLPRSNLPHVQNASSPRLRQSHHAASAIYSELRCTANYGNRA